MKCIILSQSILQYCTYLCDIMTECKGQLRFLKWIETWESKGLISEWVSMTQLMMTLVLAFIETLFICWETEADGKPIDMGVMTYPQVLNDTPLFRSKFNNCTYAGGTKLRLNFINSEKWNLCTEISNQIISLRICSSCYPYRTLDWSIWSRSQSAPVGPSRHQSI